MVAQRAGLGDGAPGPREVSEAVGEFCRCFNRADYFEAHEVLEAIWLPARRTDEGEYWQGLIQLAAAFVHVQRGRRGPALSLLRSAKRRLTAPNVVAAQIDAVGAARLADAWERRVASAPDADLPVLLRQTPPQLALASIQ
jgi:hypothetical protein